MTAGLVVQGPRGALGTDHPLLLAVVLRLRRHWLPNFVGQLVDPPQVLLPLPGVLDRELVAVLRVRLHLVAMHQMAAVLEQLLLHRTCPRPLRSRLREWLDLELPLEVLKRLCQHVIVEMRQCVLAVELSMFRARRRRHLSRSCRRYSVP